MTDRNTSKIERLDRRTFVRGIGVTGAAAIGLSHDRGAAQDAEAIAPLVGYAVGAAAVSAVGGIGLGWSLREFEVIGSDDPPDGLTASALKQQSFQTARTRKSTNASTIIDNENILDGVEHTAYTEAKIASIEALNEGLSESEVLSAASDAVNSYSKTVITNLLNSWNESVNELTNMLETLSSHPDAAEDGVFVEPSGSVGDDMYFTGYRPDSTTSYTFEDGDTLTVQQAGLRAKSTTNDNSNVYHWSPLGLAGEGSQASAQSVKASYDGTSFEYLGSDWIDLLSEAETTFQNVRDGISTWVTNVYGDVQSGDIEVTDLVTPKERAAMMADGEGTSQAIADLIALNIPVDPEREATITIGDTGATLPGTFALTDESDGPLEAGTTYDPSNFSGDIYFNTDMSLVEGPWDAINTSVDGGVITITTEPYEATAIEVTTTAGETVSIPAADWSAVDGSETWTYDASGGLETSITEVDSARFHATATETQYETLQLKGSFTVNKLVDTQSGEEVNSTSFESSEPQTDSNYITQDEWDDLQQQNEELIEKYEESQSGGAGAGFFSGDSSNIGVIAAVLGVAGVAYSLFGQGEA